MSLQCTAPDDVVARLRRADRRRLGGACAGLAVAVLVLALLRVVWGTYQVTVPDLVRILGGETIPGASFIVLEEKLPRAVAAVLTGAALGAAGALYRRTLRNPLASPDILGVTQGAAAAVVLGMLATAGQTGGASDLTRAATALIGGLAAVAAVFATARSVGGERFVVAGIAVAAAGQAVVAGAMLSLAQHDLQSATVWIAGSLNGVTWGRIALLAAQGRDQFVIQIEIQPLPAHLSPHQAALTVDVVDLHLGGALVRVAHLYLAHPLRQQGQRHLVESRIQVLVHLDDRIALLIHQGGRLAGNGVLAGPEFDGVEHEEIRRGRQAIDGGEQHEDAGTAVAIVHHAEVALGHHGSEVYLDHATTETQARPHSQQQGQCRGYLGQGAHDGRPPRWPCPSRLSKAPYISGRRSR